MIVIMSMIELESLFGPLFDEYLNAENQVVSKSFVVTTADASDKRQQQPDSTSSTSTLATTVTADGNFDLVILFSIHGDEWKSFQSQHQTTLCLTVLSVLRRFGNENKQAWYKCRCCIPILAKSDSSPYAHTEALNNNHSAYFPIIKDPQREKDDQESQIKMIHVKKMMQDKDLKHSKSKDEGSRSSY
ncbi:hypothetical protein Tco_0909384 [Tanacetum coccineum]|uniref:Uncharacterized protein n=1 Tax=Tanacetum coccineum TaxID=301880 RepID=A0ABQ5CX23_9ASTR